MKSFLRTSLALFAMLPMLALAQINPSSQKLSHEMSSAEYQLSLDFSRAFQQTDPPSGSVESIAEYEPMQAVIVRYPFGIPVELIKQMSEVVDVITIVSSSSAQNTVTSTYTNAGIDISKCKFLIAPSNSYWTRDYTGWFIANNDQIALVDFPYNRPRPQDDEMPKHQAAFLNIPLYGMNVVQTGGNFMADGYGIAAQSHIAYTENPSISSGEVDKRMKDYLGITNLQVMQDPNGEYINHVDCWAKFLAPDKVLVRRVPTSHPQYAKIEAAAAHFAEMTNAWGTKFSVYRADTPGDQPYSNSLILNDHVFVPSVGNSALDEAALAVYREAMPGYTVVGVKGLSSDPWLGTDALHCRTHEIADLGMLRITHKPLIGEVEAEQFVVNARVVSFSKAAINNVTCYYRVDASADAPYTEAAMTAGENGNYSFEFPALADGAKVQYYITASDASPRTESYPYVGKAAPFNFVVRNATSTCTVLGEKDALSAWFDSDGQDLNVIANLPAPANYNIDLINIDGQRVLNLSQNLPAGVSVFSTPAAKLAKGVYVLRISGPKFESTVKLMK